MLIVPHVFLNRSQFVCDMLQYCYDYNIINIVYRSSLYIIVMGFARSARSDPQHPHDAMGLHAVYRMAAGRWAGETILWMYTLQYILYKWCVYDTALINRYDLFVQNYYLLFEELRGYCTILRITLYKFVSMSILEKVRT